jgi:carbamoyl-phosphate synthase small subunit
MGGSRALHPEKVFPRMATPIAHAAPQGSDEPAAAVLARPGTARPDWADAGLFLADGTVIWGKGAGAPGTAVGELVFNTALTGYQEILTDPSYAGQIISFTFPHIGNVGTNAEDIETVTPAARGCVLRAGITEPSNYRAAQHLDTWLKSHDLPAVTGVDTRRITRRVRDGGAPHCVLRYDPAGRFDLDDIFANARAWPGLVGMDLAREVTCRQTFDWDQTRWRFGEGYGRQTAPRFKVVAVDYGAKRNILRSLADAGCAVTVVPATATAEDILRHKPDGVFLSNGPGDPVATGSYAVPVIRQLIRFELPIFGICLGHQMLALALGATTRKMHLGHHGANHPVKDLETGKVEITSQNHGFVVESDTLPAGVTATHVSLFDRSLEGLKVEGKPVFSVQYHPEASPGPQDSHYLFDRFIRLMEKRT